MIAILAGRTSYASSPCLYISQRVLSLAYDVKYMIASIFATIYSDTAHAPTISVARSDTHSYINTCAKRYMNDYGNAILRLAYTYVHNMADAEDILQETLIRVLEANPTFESSAHEKSYIIKTASNLSKNRIKYNAIRDTDELSEELIASDREDLSFVWDAVKSLPDMSRDVIHLHYYEGYSTKDIASILDRNESTVRSDLMRARERLKNILKEEYDFE
jgi:RNA polymerase sigma factor (sigma-70 family)